VLDLKVNRFIRNRRGLIEVLNEQKQAIISRAVALGIDPDVPLKPSGIDWLGDIPAHWEVRRLRNMAELRVSNIDKHTKKGEYPVRLCNYTDVYKNKVIKSDMSFMAATATRNEIQAFRLHVDDVIITKDSEDWQDIGVPAFVAETAGDLVCGYHLAILRPMPNVAVGRFLFYALQCKGIVAQLSLVAKGVTRYGLSHGAIKTISLPAPPIEEQEPIAQYIDEVTVSLDEAIARATREIDLIREYRTRLISDVVTGKIDVRHLAPPPGSEDLEDMAEALEPLEDVMADVEIDDEEAVNEFD
jgi:type I restriction enzyme S subunit